MFVTLSMELHRSSQKSVTRSRAVESVQIGLQRIDPSTFDYAIRLNPVVWCCNV